MRAPPKSQMNVNTYNKTDYENKSNWTIGQNKPNSNPIAERVKLMQSLYLQRIMNKNAAKGYEKTKPKQTQFQKEPKMNANVFITKDYENETALRPQKNKPKQSQFLCPQRGKTEVRCRFSEVIYLSSAFCFLSSVHGHQPPPTSYLPPPIFFKIYSQKCSYSSVKSLRSTRNF